MADHEITEAYRYRFKADKRDARREVTAAIIRAEDGGGLALLAWVPAEATLVTARVSPEEEYQRAIEGVPAAEIAERIDKSRTAVPMIVSRVRDKLRERGVAKGEDRGVFVLSERTNERYIVTP